MKRDRKEYCKQYRKKLLQKINADVTCQRCGCNDFDCLEINHKNGGGSKEIKTHGGSMQLHHAIRRGDRKTDDLELLCRPCNSIDHLERKLNRKIPLHVVWDREGFV